MLDLPHGMRLRISRILFSLLARKKEYHGAGLKTNQPYGLVLGTVDVS